jgi:cell division protein ZapA
MNTKKASVSVTMGGQKLAIRSEHPEAYIRALADYVNQKVGDLQRHSKSAGGQQLALLAAMNIADELFTAQVKQKEFKSKVQKKGEQMMRALELAMQNAAARRTSLPPSRSRELSVS